MVFFARPRKRSSISPKSLHSTFTKVRILVRLAFGKLLFETSPRYLLSNIIISEKDDWHWKHSAISKMSIYITPSIFLIYSCWRSNVAESLRKYRPRYTYKTAIDRIIGPIYGNPICMSTTMISRILSSLNYPIKPILILWPFACWFNCSYIWHHEDRINYYKQK